MISPKREICVLGSIYHMDKPLIFKKKLPYGSVLNEWALRSTYIPIAYRSELMTKFTRLILKVVELNLNEELLIFDFFFLWK